MHPISLGVMFICISLSLRKTELATISIWRWDRHSIPCNKSIYPFFEALTNLPFILWFNALPKIPSTVVGGYQQKLEFFLAATMIEKHTLVTPPQASWNINCLETMKSSAKSYSNPFNLDFSLPFPSSRSSCKYWNHHL